MAAPEAEVTDFDDGKEAFDSFISLCHAVADANAAAGSSDPQPSPKASAAPVLAATPKAAAVTPKAAAWAADAAAWPADEPAMTPQQPAAPPPWWAWRERAEAEWWASAAEEAAAEHDAWEEWETEGWQPRRQEPETYAPAAREPVSSEIFHELRSGWDHQTPRRPIGSYVQDSARALRPHLRGWPRSSRARARSETRVPMNLRGWRSYSGSIPV